MVLHLYNTFAPAGSVSAAGIFLYMEGFLIKRGLDRICDMHITIQSRNLTSPNFLESPQLTFLSTGNSISIVKPFEMPRI